MFTTIVIYKEIYHQVFSGEMQDSLNSYQGRIGFIHSPSAMAEAAAPASRLKHALPKLRIGNVTSQANRLIGKQASVANALAVAAVLALLAAVSYDRASIAQDAYNADVKGAAAFRHSPFGIAALPFKSVYAVSKVTGSGPCAKLIAAEVVPMNGGGTYVYSAADVDGQNIVRQWLTNKRVVTVGQCAGAVAVPTRIKTNTTKPHKAKAPRF